MKGSDHQLVRDLFHELFDLTPEDRERELATRDVPEEIRADVLSLFGQSDPIPLFAEPALGEVAHRLIDDAGSEGNEAPWESVLDRIGPYALQERIGQGGMGVVYSARRDGSDQLAALKVLSRPAGAGDALSRFRREAELLRQLRHPGIAAFYDWGEAELGPGSRAVPYLAMELVDGLSLREYAIENGLDDRQRIELVARVCDAVHHAHEKGIVHRDLKPSNVLVEERDRDPVGQPKVLDFGIARVTDADAPTVTATRAGALLGTLSYMSPEQASGGAQEVGAPSDVYSLGVLLYELLSGNLPIDVRGRSISAVLELIQFREPTRLGRYSPAFRGDLEWVVGCAIEKEPGRRYGSAADFAWDLRAYLAKKPVSARPPSPWRRLRRWTSKRPVASAAIAVGVLTLAGMTVSWRQALAADAAARESESLALESERVAHERAELVERQRRGILGLSDLRKLAMLEEEAGRLWPAHPRHVEAYGAWLQRADDLVRRAAEHRSLHEELAQLDAEEVEALGVRGVSWWSATLELLLTRLEDFSSEAGQMTSVRARLDEASALWQRSIGDHRAAWDEVIADVQSRSDYGYLELVPQLGLVPLGPEETSGCWDFWFLTSGARPERDPESGRWIVAEETGLVFTLLPGGSFVMGAQANDPDGPNYDSQAVRAEEPVHEVELSPFFLSKYEMSQGQWLRATGSNPSRVTGNLGRPEVHPVNLVSWFDSLDLLQRLGLELPTESQWEYAARAGTSSPWASGPDPEALADHANIADATARDGGPESWIYEAWDDGYDESAPVDALEPNPFGLFNMFGNIGEWCADEFGPYGEERVVDPVRVGAGGEMEAERMFRGGAFNDPAFRARSSYRRYETPAGGSPFLGVRPARALDMEEPR